MTSNVSWLVAFTAGLLSFLSPCVLPIVPSYLCFITIFVALGSTASAISQQLKGHMWLINKVGGLLVILFGFYIMGAFKLDFLMYEQRFHFSKKPVGLIGSFLVGMAFAAGWTPCI